MSRWHVLLVLAATSGCLFDVSYVPGYMVTYGSGRWRRGSTARVISGLAPSEAREAVEQDGIFSFREQLYLPLPTDGRVMTAAETRVRKQWRMLVIGLRLSEEGRQKVSSWRDAGRTRRLVLSTDRGDFSAAVFETDNLPDPYGTPYSADDIRSMFDDQRREDLPEYVATMCVRARGVLKLHKGHRWGATREFRPDSEVDIFQRRPERPPGRSAGYPGGAKSQLPIDLRLVGEFRDRSGQVEQRKVRLQYDKWNWRLHFGDPYDPHGMQMSTEK